MDISSKNFLIQRGYKEDNNCTVIKDIFSKNDFVKKINVSIRESLSGSLFARFEEKNVKLSFVDEEKRIIINKGKNIIMNIIADNIQECLFTKYGNSYEFDFYINSSICYSLFIKL